MDAAGSVERLAEAAARSYPVACAGFIAASFAAFLIAWQAHLSAGQQTNQTVSVDSDDLGGVVTGPTGPEAGVWVIAETKDLPTKFVKIVVTDDRGRRRRCTATDRLAGSRVRRPSVDARPARYRTAAAEANRAPREHSHIGPPLGHLDDRRHASCPSDASGVMF
jgi:hypothetical protein